MGQGRPADWADAVEAARTVAREAGAELGVRKGQYGPWHPGRCAELTITVDGAERVIGHAGELHPRVLKALGLPARSCAMELDLDALEQVGDDTPAGAGHLHLPGRHAGRRAGRRRVRARLGRRGGAARGRR
ncbi:hypothetical protein GCM10023238_33290 [Streptomyces heliomycini]